MLTRICLALVMTVSLAAAKPKPPIGPTRQQIVDSCRLKITTQEAIALQQTTTRIQALEIVTILYRDRLEKAESLYERLSSANVSVDDSLAYWRRNGEMPSAVTSRVRREVSEMKDELEALEELTASLRKVDKK